MCDLSIPENTENPPPEGDVEEFPEPEEIPPPVPTFDSFAHVWIGVVPCSLNNWTTPNSSKDLTKL